MSDGFGLIDHNIKNISIKLYIDEIKLAPDKNEEKWSYIGVLAVPNACFTDTLSNLLGFKEDVNYQGVIHFDELKNKSAKSPKIIIAEKWLRFTQSSNSNIYFKILGLKIQNLCKEAFDEDHFHSTVYHRFLRTAITGLLNGVFKDYVHIEITDIIHDSTNKPRHWEELPISKMIEEDSLGRLDFVCNEIQFIRSDHTNTEGHHQHSHFIQLIDLILGNTRYILDFPKYYKGADFLCNNWHTLISELNHKNKSFKYKSKFGISYFPSKKFTYDDILDDRHKYKDNFFQSKTILWENKDIIQPTLFKF